MPPQIITALNSVPVDIRTGAHESSAKLVPAFTFFRNSSERKDASVRMWDLGLEVDSKSTLIKASSNPESIFNKGGSQRCDRRPVFDTEYVIDSCKQTEI